jgi:hypothetical protein
MESWHNVLVSLILYTGRHLMSENHCFRKSLGPCIMGCGLSYHDGGLRLTLVPSQT